MGSGLPKIKLLCSRAPLHALVGSRLYFLKFEKIAMGIVWAPGLQAFKMMGSRAPATPSLGASEEHRSSRSRQMVFIEKFSISNGVN